MRVVGGSLKGKRLSEFKGLSIRPTSDKIRQALFNIIYQPDAGVCYKSILDLFAGTGALGIEAMSRGAEKAVFVEDDPSALSVINKNLENCKLGNAQVLRSGAGEALSRLILRHEQFDLIFIDPPYASTLAVQSLKTIDESPDILSDYGLCVVETSKRTRIESEFKTLQLVDERRYGDTLLYFYRKASG